jgi:anti-sigma-K factor RskA
MDHEDYKAMLAAHALSSVDREDARALEEHLAACADCRAELDSWKATASALAYSAQPLEPSAQLRDRILESARTEASRSKAENVVPISRAQRSRAWPGGFQAIAASIIFLGLIAGLVVLWRQNREAKAEIAHLSAQITDTRRKLDQEHEALELFAQPGTRMAELAGTKDAPRAHAMLAVDNKSGRAVLMAHGLPQAPAGMAYQLWFIAGARPMPGKVFQTDSSGNAMLNDQLPADALKASAFAVTLEPQAGVPAPTGPMYLLTPSPRPAS